MNNYTHFNWEEIHQRYAETEQFLKEAAQILQRAAARMERNEEIATKRSAEIDAELSKLRKENEEIATKRRSELDAELSKLRKENEEVATKRKAELDASLKKLGKYIGGIANNNGDMAEDFFFNTFRRDKTLLNEQFDTIQKNYFYSSTNGYEGPESDIVLFNGKSVAIIEVKYKATFDNIDFDKLIENVALFKKYSPAYRNHNIFLGVAAMSFKKGLASKLHKAGIATIHPSGKKIVIYDKELKVF